MPCHYLISSQTRKYILIHWNQSNQIKSTNSMNSRVSAANVVDDDIVAVDLDAVEVESVTEAKASMDWNLIPMNRRPAAVDNLTMMIYFCFVCYGV